MISKCSGENGPVWPFLAVPSAASSKALLISDSEAFNVGRSGTVWLRALGGLLCADLYVPGVLFLVRIRVASDELLGRKRQDKSSWCAPSWQQQTGSV